MGGCSTLPGLLIMTCVGLLQDRQRRSDGGKLLSLGSTFMRDVPYSWNTMVDNL